MLMPSHAKNVKVYKDTVPLFQRYQIEAQLDAMFTPTVTLKSGGYIVINQTEALVSIDVNSGRATREHSIEDTAYKTNLEAADEIARQLRLRDLAGLIVIDFIDMEDTRNDRNVEKRLRDATKNDRARVQIGRISQFGLLEMSRQRLRAGVVAGSTVPCPHCGGQGIVRSIESTVLRVMRGLEEEAQRQRSSALAVRAPREVAIYALNKKRREIAHIETEYDLLIQFEAKDDMLAGTFEIERTTNRLPDDHTRSVAPPDRVASPSPIAQQERLEGQGAADGLQGETQSGATGPSKRRRRRRRGRDRDRPPSTSPLKTEPRSETAPQPLLQGQEERQPAVTALTSNSGPETTAPAPSPTSFSQQPSSGHKRRRRRRGRRSGSDSGPSVSHEQPQRLERPNNTSEPSRDNGAESNFSKDVSVFMPNAPSEPVWSLSSERSDAASQQPNKHVTVLEEPADGARSQEQEGIRPVSENAAEAISESDTAVAREADGPATPPKRGWWQRPFRERG